MATAQSAGVLPQSTMQKFYLKRQQRSDLEAQARKIKRDEDALKEIITKAIDNNYTIEAGALTAKFVPGAVRPSWKDEFVKRCGEDAAEEVIANTPPSKTLEVCSIYDTE